MKKEQIKKLKAVEADLRRAYYSDYKRGTTNSENELVFDVLDDITGKKNIRNYTCNTCILNAFRKVGEAYFKALAEKENTKATTTETIIETVKNSNPTRKRGGRPRGSHKK